MRLMMTPMAKRYNVLSYFFIPQVFVMQVMGFFITSLIQTKRALTAWFITGNPQPIEVC
jgi:hypothetical protein